MNKKETQAVEVLANLKRYGKNGTNAKHYGTGFRLSAAIKVIRRQRGEKFVLTLYRNPKKKGLCYYVLAEYL